MIATDNTPRVWVGCLACYNDGKLVGQWYDAIEADEVTPATLHEVAGNLANDAELIESTHEELWVMDHENLPISGECSPAEAAKIAQGMASVPDYIPADAVRAYIENTGTSDIDWDTIADDVQEAYAGEWSDLGEYAYDLFKDTAASREMVDALDSWPFTCIDWNHAGRELEMGGDVWTADTASGFYVFRAI